jgi:hypothetical protein
MMSISGTLHWQGEIHVSPLGGLAYPFQVMRGHSDDFSVWGYLSTLSIGAIAPTDLLGAAMVAAYSTYDGDGNDIVVLAIADNIPQNQYSQFVVRVTDTWLFASAATYQYVAMGDYTFWTWLLPEGATPTYWGVSDGIVTPFEIVP